MFLIRIQNPILKHTPYPFFQTRTAHRSQVSTFDPKGMEHVRPSGTRSMYQTEDACVFSPWIVTAQYLSYTYIHIVITYNHIYIYILDTCFAGVQACFVLANLKPE